VFACGCEGMTTLQLPTRGRGCSRSWPAQILPGLGTVWRFALVDQVELFSRLEANGFAWSDCYLCAGARIAANAGLAGPHVEYAKTSELDTLTRRQSLLQAFKDGIDRCLCLIAGRPVRSITRCTMSCLIKAFSRALIQR
jgi:hypothetical protein